VSEAIRKIGKQVAHDIRSPLSALNVLVKKSKTLGGDEKSILSAAAERINNIAGDILDVEKRLNSGILISPIDIGRVLNESVAEKRLQLESNIQTAKILLNFPNQSEPVFVLADQEHLRRILSNILNNSIEALSDKGCITVTVHQNDKFATIIVEDNGSGISPEVLSRIGQQPVTTKAEGHGIGLSSAFESVQDWGGKISIQSKEGLGTRVVLSLPISSAVA
jgi:signal transduction histidine kinase